MTLKLKKTQVKYEVEEYKEQKIWRMFILLKKYNVVISTYLFIAEIA